MGSLTPEQEAPEMGKQQGNINCSGKPECKTWRPVAVWALVSPLGALQNMSLCPHPLYNARCSIPNKIWQVKPVKALCLNFRKFRQCMIIAQIGNMSLSHSTLNFIWSRFSSQEAPRGKDAVSFLVMLLIFSLTLGFCHRWELPVCLRGMDGLPT